MQRLVKSWTWFVVSLLLICSLGSQPARAQSEVSTGDQETGATRLVPWLAKVDPRSETSPPRLRGMVASRPVVIESQRVLENNRIRLPLTDPQSSVILVRDPEQPAPQTRGVVWVGSIEGDAGSRAIISVVGETVVCKIVTGRNYIFFFIGVFGEPSWVIQIDPSQFEFQAEIPRVPIPGELRSFVPTCGQTDPPTYIDALVVYTPEAMNPMGTGTLSEAGMEAFIQDIFTETNQSFARSQVNPRLRLVHTEQVDYHSSHDVWVDLAALEDPADGTIDNVGALRDLYGADVVIMIIDQADDWSGASDPMLTISHAWESHAFGVVVDWAAFADHALSHELGHLMGAAHMCDEGGNVGAADYSHAHSGPCASMSGGGWRTIMAQPSGYSRIGYFSNPAVTEPTSGLQTGEMTASCQADNSRILNDSALTVANFRCSTDVATDVWMRDTWDDTGLEPDPATAGEDMWDSPYIWVRTDQDVDRHHLHEHQNPQFGSTNWIYVKLHNSFSTVTSGNVEIYWAPASTASLWSGGWTLLQSIPITAFPAHSTEVVEARWDNLPGVGSYCLAAHWSSTSDPSPLLATSDMEPNVRQSNNLVWKNLTIVQLLILSAAVNVRFDVHPAVDAIGDPEMQSTTLVIRSQPYKGKSFFELGQVRVEFDAALLNAWRLGGFHGHGYNFGDDGILITAPGGAVFDDILLPSDAVGQMSLEFRRFPSTPVRTYVIDVEQSRRNRVLGGLRFEVRTRASP